MIYLDSAATTLQKPRAVSDALAGSVTRLASPGRGGHRAAMEAGELVFRCRLAAAELFDTDDPERVVFTFNATHGLNIAVRSLVREGNTVLLSGYEHNAVTRPLAAIPGIRIKIPQAPMFRPDLFLEAFDRALTGEVDAAVCTHVSNVFGYIQPLEEMAALCRERGIPLIVDASQSAGCLPISLKKLGAAFIAMPGHKGLYGPQGTGILLCGGESEPVLYGGTGSQSLRQTMPEFLPDRLEAGTHNVPGIAGLLEGLRFVKRMGETSILKHERKLIQRLAEGLRELRGVEVFCAPKPEWQSGVCSFRCAGMDCEELGEKLGERGIAVRAGLHCAPLAHRTAGTLESGTVRVSVSAFNTEQETEVFLERMGELTRGMNKM